MGKVIWLTFVTVFSLFILIETSNHHDKPIHLVYKHQVDPNARCVPVTIDLCKEFYNETMFPNIRYYSQEEAAVDLNYRLKQIGNNCSPYLRYFACTAFIPKCIPSNGPMIPCRRLCEIVKKDCGWNNTNDCAAFSDEEPCVDESSVDIKREVEVPSKIAPGVNQTIPVNIPDGTSPITGQTGTKPTPPPSEKIPGHIDRNNDSEAKLVSALNRIADSLNNVAKAITGRNSLQNN